LSLQFAFATQEGARPVAAPWRGRPRPDTAAIVILPTEGNASAAPAHRAAGAAAAGHANVAFLPSGAAVDASAVLAQRRASSDQALVHDSNGWVITTVSRILGRTHCSWLPWAPPPPGLCLACCCAGRG
jgi:hypothetical protein